MPEDHSRGSRLVRARVVSNGQAVGLSSAGIVTPFKGAHGEGSAFFAHRPRPGPSIAFEHSARLRQHGANYCFEFQVQCHFKARPRGTVFIAAELRDHPMKLNLVTRALCRVLLGFIQKQAARRGIELRYSFGDSTSLANVTFPLLAADRVVLSDGPAQLPFDTEQDKGTWHLKDGKLVPIDRNTIVLDDEHYVTAMFATSFIDFNSWSLVGIPGVGQLTLEQFWGSQALHAVFFEDDAVTKRRIFFEMELASVTDAKEDVPPEAPALAKPTAPDSTSNVKETVLEFAADTVEEPQTTAPEDAEELGSVYSERERRGPCDSSDDEFDDPEPGDEDGDFQSVISTHSRGIVDRLDKRTLSKDHFELPESSDRGASVAIPWYFLNGAGDLWWCISFRGRLCWRHNSQLRALCSALGAQQFHIDGKSSVQDSEAGRRLASKVLTQGCSAPGLLEEFTREDVELSSLLSGEVRPRDHAMFLGIVEAEGRIAERYARLQGDSLRWRFCRSGSRRKARISVDLRRADLGVAHAAGAQAVTLRTPQRAYILIAKDAAHYNMILETLQKSGIGGSEPGLVEMHGGGALLAMLSSMQEVFVSSLRRAAAWVPNGSQRAADQRNSTNSTVSSRAIDTAASVQQRAAVAATTVQQRAAVAANSVQQRAAAAAVHIRGPRAAVDFDDPLSRWPESRIVINDAEPWLEQPASALPLSAELLRSALAAQGGTEEALQTLVARSCALKCVSLAPLSPQELWGFWVNVFHSLLVHAQLVAGRPRMVQHIVSFFNSCSYVVAGHVFSLAEIEHCILRRHMTKPKIRFVRSILRIWPRSEEDLESRPCLAAPQCPASCFGCRPDWRLNLVLNAGNHGSSDSVPVFEAMDEAAFEATITCAMNRTLTCCGSASKDSIELPYTLCRFRDDAPPGVFGDASERRWARALMPDLAQAAVRIGYSRTYGWAMRSQLQELSVNEEEGIRSV